MFEEYMKNYAEESGAIAEFESTGRVSEEYQIHEIEMYERFIGQKHERGTPIIL